MQGVPADPDALAAHVAAHPGASAGVVLDCTASDELPARYADWLGGLGLHIITPNKKLGAGPLQRQQELVRMAAATGRRFLYEAVSYTTRTTSKNQEWLRTVVQIVAKKIML